jgi:LPS-assembly protein
VGTALALALGGHAAPATAQLSGLAGTASGPPVSPEQPVTFTADAVEYDQDRGLVTASGHVEAWQNDRVVRADKIIFDRNTNVAAATGNVVLLEPDGQVVFSDYAELAEGMKNGVLRGMRALLAENGKLAANGARRTEGKINELARVVYSTCNLCQTDPTRPPLWQIRALNAVQDVEHKKIEYEDAVLDMLGVPVAYFPYFWHVDPSVKRASGLLIPTIGTSSALGAFVAVPYYWVLDDQQDVTITPWVTTKQGVRAEIDYRLRLNEGALRINSSVGETDGTVQGHIFSQGRFDYDDTWRYGFDLNRASSSTYLRDFHVSGYADTLVSQGYIEGFGQGSYTRLDSRFYQPLLTGTNSDTYPLVLPRYLYDFVGQPDGLGGRLHVNAGAFNVLRNVGTNTERANATLDWQRPATGPLGDQWNLELHLDSATYNASKLNEQPNFSPLSSSDVARALPQAALMLRWPLIRNGGASGTQIIEPIAQVIVAPNAGDSQLTRIPNEDSLDFEFTDANLFALNKFNGIDRLEGGVRANVGLHGSWFVNGVAFDGLIGQSYRTEQTDIFPTGSGLNGTVSDIVARASVQPTSWLDLTYRTRLDHDNLAVRMADGLVSVGDARLSVFGGYLYTTTDPYELYDQPPSVPNPSLTTPRNEISFGASTHFGHWRLSGAARRNLQDSTMVSAGIDGAYEDECFIFEVKANRRFTSLNGDNGDTIVLFQITFKTVGTFGFNAL